MRQNEALAVMRHYPEAVKALINYMTDCRDGMQTLCDSTARDALLDDRCKAAALAYLGTVRELNSIIAELKKLINT